MKIFTGTLLLLLLTFSLTVNAQAVTDSSLDVKVGPGVGIPYGGVVGGNIEISPFDYFSLLAGVGITQADLGWVVGGRIYLTDRNHRVRPHLGYYAGTVAVEKIQYYYYDDYKNIDGTAAGFGITFNIKEHLSLDGEIIYILSNQSNLTLDSPVKIAFGVHF